MSTLYHYLAAYYDIIFPHNPLKNEFLNEFIPDKETIEILDIGCATGELAISLSAQEYRLTGIDFDEKLIAIAKSKVKSSQNPVEFLQADMKDIDHLFQDQRFDIITCFGNTLVHLENETVIAEFIRKCYNKLNPKGKLITQTVNYDQLNEQRINELPEIEREGIIFKRMYLYDAYPDKINFKVSLTIKDEDKSFTANTLLVPIQSQKLDNMLINSGFRSRIYGSFKREEFKKDSPALIAVGEKI